MAPMDKLFQGDPGEAPTVNALPDEQHLDETDVGLLIDNRQPTAHQTTPQMSCQQERSLL